MSTYEITAIIERDDSEEPVLYKYLVLQVIDEKDEETLGQGMEEDLGSAKSCVEALVTEALRR